MITSIFLATAGIIGVFFLVAPRPKLDPTAPASPVPADLPIEDLDAWLAEAEPSHVVDGAEAAIHWHGTKQKTPLCFLYVHGFSATRQETAPLTEQVAEHFDANIVYARMAGHGLTTDSMQASAEDWLGSITMAFDLASRVGEKTIVIATSNGAPLTIWALQHLPQASQVAGLIFCAPNFRIRNPFDFLLTWPLAHKWVPYVIGKEHSWEPENELAAKYWSHRYATTAIIEMQKVVDWVKRSRQRLDSRNIPLQTLYMQEDPTISAQAAVEFHSNWEAEEKDLHEITIDIENPQHVFVGNITAPHRVEWCVNRCRDFISRFHS